MNIEDAIARIERGARLMTSDGMLGGYVLEVNEWREIRAMLRDACCPYDCSICHDGCGFQEDRNTT